MHESDKAFSKMYKSKLNSNPLDSLSFMESKVNTNLLKFDIDFFINVTFKYYLLQDIWRLKMFQWTKGKLWPQKL